ncbi:MBL fold metallo-hydrolase, partial [bacterium]|nr:MBL fold metallo-hydrolase [bacterium]
SLNFSFDLNFPLFAGWLLPPEDEIVLITDSAEDVASAVRFLHQVGIDHIAGWLDGGVRAWKIASLPTASFSVFGEEEFLNRLQNPSEMQLVDVRQVMERAGTDIPEAINIPVPELRQRSAELPENKQLILICQGGARGSLAAGLLWQNGFRNLVNVAGGFDDIRHLFGY